MRVKTAFVEETGTEDRHESHGNGVEEIELGDPGKIEEINDAFDDILNGNVIRGVVKP